MAISESVAIAANPEEVWKAICRIVTVAGYPVERSDSAQKELQYSSEFREQGFIFTAKRTHRVTINLTCVDRHETIVLVTADGKGTWYEDADSSLKSLVKYVVGSLRKEFSGAKILPRPPGMNRGMSGCLLFFAVGAMFAVVATVFKMA